MTTIAISDPRGGEVVARQRDDESAEDFELRGAWIAFNLRAGARLLHDAGESLICFELAESLLNEGRMGGRP